LLSGIFMYSLVRYITKDKLAAFVAAVCFMFSGYTASRIWAGHFEVYTTSIWIPLVFLLYLKAIDERSKFHAMLCGVFLAVEFFAGHTQTFYFTVMILGIYMLYTSMSCFKDIPKNGSAQITKNIGYNALLLGVALLFFFLIAAVQFLPTFELIGLSTRNTGNPFFMSAYGSFAPEHLIRFILPDFFGNFLETLYAGDPIVGEIHWEINYYAGILPVFMALFVIQKKLNRWTKKILFLSTILILLCALINRIIFLQLWKVRNNPQDAGEFLNKAVKFFESLYSGGVPLVKLLPVFISCWRDLAELFFI